MENNSTSIIILQVKLGNDIISIPQKDDSLKNNFIELFGDAENNIVLNRIGFHDCIYNRILDNVPITFTFNMLIDALYTGSLYFEKMDINLKTKDRIISWVKSLGKNSYTWVELLDKPQYSLELFNKRFWPYFNVESKDWKDIASSVMNGDSDYPNQVDNINVISDRNEITRDYGIEYEIARKYNNFLGYSVLEPNKYPDMVNILDRLKIFSYLGLKLIMFEAILRLMISPSTCHIIKEPQLMTLLNPLFNENNKYKDMYIHFMYYAVYILNHEDMVIFSQIHRNYRIIFTHLESLSLPQTNKYHIELDPYIQQLTGDKYLVNSTPFYLRCNRHIQSVDTFERRFYLATGGALTNIHLSKYNAAVSGSILIPCITYSELEDDFKGIRFKTQRNLKNKNNTKFNYDLYKPVGDNTLTEEDMDFMSYLEYFYPSFHSLNNNEYIKNVLTKPKDDSELKSHNNDDEKSEKDHVINYNLLTDIDISITTDNYDLFEEISLIIGNQIKLNCQHIGEVWIKKVYTASAFKYKIYGPGLIRPIDLFRVSYGPDKMVKKFHCPIVRSWYDGSNSVVVDSFNHINVINNFWKSLKTEIINAKYVSENINDAYVNSVEEIDENKELNYIGLNMLDSSVFTSLSGVNNTYKWFFNSKPCVEVILKYAQRGFTTICNKKEILALTEYMKSNIRWKDFVTTGIDVCGIVSKNHIFFNPCSENSGIRFNLRQFKKMSLNIYSKKLYVGVADGKTEYDANLLVKENKRVYMPDTNKINLFTEFMSQIDADKYLDSECQL